MKRLLIICDGMAEPPLAALEGKTPIEAAFTPNMDALTQLCTTGTFRNCPSGFPANSDTAILTLLGYNLNKCYTGRAPLEAADCGITLAPDQAALRISFLQVEHGKIIGISPESRLKELLDSPLFPQIPGCTFHSQKNGQPLLVLDGDPGQPEQPHNHIGEDIAPLLPREERLRRLILSSLEILPGGAIWFWGAGTACTLPPFPVAGTLISATPVCRGIGILAGLDVPTVPGATGKPDTDYTAKAAAAVDAFHQGREFVAVHVEAPDDCAHRLDISGKIQTIADIDRLLLPPLLAYLASCEEDYRILLTSDHQTSSITGRHSHAPVPYFFYSTTPALPVGSAMELLFC